MTCRVIASLQNLISLDALFKVRGQCGGCVYSANILNNCIENVQLTGRLRNSTLLMLSAYLRHMTRRLHYFVSILSVSQTTMT